MTFTLQFERRFSMAHRLLSGQSKKCAIPHGHNEYIRAHLRPLHERALDNDTNMITSFANAKTAWHTFVDDYLDHSFQVRADDPIIHFFKTHQPELLPRLVITHGDPTTEMLCACLMSKLDKLLEQAQCELYCHQLTLEETPTNTVTLTGRGAYHPHLPKGDYWWNRGDYSINEFKKE